MNQGSLRQLAASAVPVRDPRTFFERELRVLAPLSEFRPTDLSLPLALYYPTENN